MSQLFDDKIAVAIKRC